MEIEIWIFMINVSQKTIWKPTGRWSVHAHCKYPDGVDFLKYDGVVNLDPSCEKEIVYMENNIKIFYHASYSNINSKK